jgi:hypothetical protein
MSLNRLPSNATPRPLCELQECGCLLWRAFVVRFMRCHSPTAAAAPHVHFTHYFTLKRLLLATRYPLAQCARALYLPWRIEPFSATMHAANLTWSFPRAVSVLASSNSLPASNCYYNSYSWSTCLTAISLNSQCAAHSVLPSLPPSFTAPVYGARVDTYSSILLSSFYSTFAI